jgi:hypothetical protein
MSGAIVCDKLPLFDAGLNVSFGPTTFPQVPGQPASA